MVFSKYFCLSIIDSPSPLLYQLSCGELKPKRLHKRTCEVFIVVPPGIEPGTQGFSVLCSTNWAMAPSGCCCFKKNLHKCACEAFVWCHQESNRGHKDFQSFALPTELWHHLQFKFRTLPFNTPMLVHISWLRCKGTAFFWTDKMFLHIFQLKALFFLIFARLY